MSYKELADELHKPIIRKFEKRKAHSPFTDNLLGADLADMQLISKFNTFWTNFPLTDKSGSWFLLAKCLKKTCGRVTF